MNQSNKILNELKRLAKKLFADGKAQAYLYGSRARGEAKKDSDWDLLIVTSDAIDSQDAFERFAYPFTELGWKSGEQITPILYTRSEWDAERNTSFFHNVNQDAIPL